MLIQLPVFLTSVLPKPKDFFTAVSVENWLHCLFCIYIYVQSIVQQIATQHTFTNNATQHFNIIIAVCFLPNKMADV